MRKGRVAGLFPRLHSKFKNMEYRRGLKKDIPIGSKFGMWTVIGDGDRFVAPCGKSYRGLLCKCDCGVVRSVRVGTLLRGATNSCGCLRPRRIVQNKKLHGQWSGMILRCENPKAKEYERYGGRGISICKEWRYSYNTFAQWALDHGWEKHLWLDRVDNNGNYTPDNCRFIEGWLSTANRSVARMVEFDGENIALGVLMRRLNMVRDYRNIYANILRGRSALGAIIMQIQLNKKKLNRAVSEATF